MLDKHSDYDVKVSELKINPYQMLFLFSHSFFSSCVSNLNSETRWAVLFFSIYKKLERQLVHHWDGRQSDCLDLEMGSKKIISFLIKLIMSNTIKKLSLKDFARMPLS